MAQDTIELIDADELDVKEVRCALSGLPIPAIPNWYANVNVRFVSDAARTKSAAARAAEYIEPEEEAAIDDTGDISLDDIDEDIAIDDIEIDLDDDVEVDE